MSGVSEVPLDAIVSDPSVLRIEDFSRPPALARLRERIAARYGVPDDHALPATGTSGAVFMTLAALLSRLPTRAKVAVERPAYGIFDSAARFLGREVVPVPRLA